jgi:hypothetical protein
LADIVWTRSPEVAVVESPGRVVVLALAHPTTARPLVMEGPAAAIWHALAEPATVAQVAELVAADFGVPATEVDGDVATFVADLESRGLLSQSVRGAQDTGRSPG